MRKLKQEGNNAMNNEIKALMVGESVFKIHTHYKGFACYETAYLGANLDFFINKVKEHGVDLDFMPNHEVSVKFPLTMEALRKYDVVIISDAPADSLLLHPNTLAGDVMPNRLSLLVEYVMNGSGLLMIGGWMSFCGFQGKARYNLSPLADIFPIKMYSGDDRMEVPEGAYPKVLVPTHPILNDIPEEWPVFLGYNKLFHDRGTTIMTINDDPFLVVDQIDKGRVGIFSSDCLPHWGTNEFCNWEYYSRFWCQLIGWLKG